VARGPSGSDPRSSPVSNPLSQENGLDTLHSNGWPLDVIPVHRLRRTLRTPMSPTLNPQVSGLNPEGRTLLCGGKDQLRTRFRGFASLPHRLRCEVRAPVVGFLRSSDDDSALGPVWSTGLFGRRSRFWSTLPPLPPSFRRSVGGHGTAHRAVRSLLGRPSKLRCLVGAAARRPQTSGADEHFVARRCALGRKCRTEGGGLSGSTSVEVRMRLSTWRTDPTWSLGVRSQKMATRPPSGWWSVPRD
jgi:hypothetical protein